MPAIEKRMRLLCTASAHRVKRLDRSNRFRLWPSCYKRNPLSSILKNWRSRSFCCRLLVACLYAVKQHCRGEKKNYLYTLDRVNIEQAWQQISPLPSHSCLHSLSVTHQNTDTYPLATLYYHSHYASIPLDSRNALTCRLIFIRYCSRGLSQSPLELE